MKDLQLYIKQFSRLNRSPNRMWGEATKNRAPHKPILLLAVLALVQRGVITTPFIDITHDLVELNDLSICIGGRLSRSARPSPAGLSHPGRGEIEPFPNLFQRYAAVRV